jgi:hypothetical protein
MRRAEAIDDVKPASAFRAEVVQESPERAEEEPHALDPVTGGIP